MQVVRYLDGTWNLGIVYGTSDMGLQGWTDADFMGDTRDTRNTTGMVLQCMEGLSRGNPVFSPPSPDQHAKRSTWHRQLAARKLFGSGRCCEI